MNSSTMTTTLPPHRHPNNPIVDLEASNNSLIMAREEMMNNYELFQQAMQQGDIWYVHSSPTQSLPLYIYSEFRD